LKVPHPSEESKDFFESLIPDDDPRITIRPMFGNLASFVNGNLFAGLFGDSLFVRLSQSQAEEFQKIKGTKNFEPMEGRPMKAYFLVPKSWMTQPDLVKPWIMKALESTGKVESKKKKKPARKKSFFPRAP